MVPRRRPAATVDTPNSTTVQDYPNNGENNFITRPPVRPRKRKLTPESSFQPLIVAARGGATAARAATVAPVVAGGDGGIDHLADTDAGVGSLLADESPVLVRVGTGGITGVTAESEGGLRRPVSWPGNRKGKWSLCADGVDVGGSIGGEVQGGCSQMIMSRGLVARVMKKTDAVPMAGMAPVAAQTTTVTGLSSRSEYGLFVV